MKTHRSMAFAALLAFVFLAGCSFPLFGKATLAISTPLPQSSPTFPPPVTVTISTNVIPHLSSGTEVILTSIHMLSLKTGWAIGTALTEANAHILHTADGGLTWKDMTPPEPLDTNGTKTAIAYFASDSTLWVAYSLVQSTLQANPGNPIVIWTSADGGVNWKTSAPLDPAQGFEFYQPGLITFSDASHGWYLVHVGVGMSHDYAFFYSTSDAGKTWVKLADPYGTTSFPQVCCKIDMAFTDANYGWLAGNTNGVVPGIFFYQTADGGVTWSLVNLPPPAAYPNIYNSPDYACGTYQVQFVDGKNGFLGAICFAQIKAAHLGWLYVTHDGGQTWAAQDIPPQPQGLFQFLSATQGWYVGDKVYKTTDGASHWTPGAPVTWTGLPNFVDSINGWLIASKESALALVRSSDGGGSWELLKPVIAP